MAATGCNEALIRLVVSKFSEISSFDVVNSGITPTPTGDSEQNSPVHCCPPLPGVGGLLIVHLDELSLLLSSIEATIGKIFYTNPLITS